MALYDLCGRAAGQPLYRLLGGLRRNEVSYFYYLARGGDDDLRRSAPRAWRRATRRSTSRSASIRRRTSRWSATVRAALGPRPAAARSTRTARWSVPEALRILGRMAEHDIDLVEQPVRDHPIGQLAEVRARLPMAVCANEGLWSEADAYARIRARQADVYCFSPYWVGSIGAFHRLAHVAHLEGLQVCKHTHGELGLAAAASQHVLLTLPNIVEGHQQTAHVMAGDILDGAAADRDDSDVGRAGGRRVWASRSMPTRSARPPAATSWRASSCRTSASSWAARPAPDGLTAVRGERARCIVGACAA